LEGQWWLRRWLPIEPQWTASTLRIQGNCVCLLNARARTILPLAGCALHISWCCFRNILLGLLQTLAVAYDGVYVDMGMLGQPSLPVSPPTMLNGCFDTPDARFLPCVRVQRLFAASHRRPFLQNARLWQLSTSSFDVHVTDPATALELNEDCPCGGNWTLTPNRTLTSCDPGRRFMRCSPWHAPSLLGGTSNANGGTCMQAHVTTRHSLVADLRVVRGCIHTAGCLRHALSHLRAHLRC
jgi:hypothetical protein